MFRECAVCDQDYFIHKHLIYICLNISVIYHNFSTHSINPGPNSYWAQNMWESSRKKSVYDNILHNA